MSTWPAAIDNSVKDQKNDDGWTAAYVNMRDLLLATSREELTIRSRHLNLQVGDAAWHFMYGLPNGPEDQMVYDNPLTSADSKLEHLRQVLDKGKRTTPGFMLPFMDS